MALAVSGFGQGWYMRFTPQRLMIFLGVPLSILAAQALDGLRTTQEFEAIHSRHTQIADDQVDRFFFENSQTPLGILTVGGDDPV